jgi:hypothetical protein
MIPCLHLGDIRKVTLLALFISAHLDESGTHKGSKFTTMGGWIATEEQWLGFPEAWSQFLSQYEVSSFHSHEFWHGEGQFAGWSDRKKRKFLSEAMVVLQNATIMSIGTGIINEQYDKFRSTFKVKRYRKDSKYGFCFRLCLGMSLNYVIEKCPKERISFLLESGDPNAGDAQRIFDGLKNGMTTYGGGRPTVVAPYLGSLSFDSKVNFPSLEGADLVASDFYQRLLEGRYKQKHRPSRNLRYLAGASDFAGLQKVVLAERERHIAFSAERLKAASRRTGV